MRLHSIVKRACVAALITATALTGANADLDAKTEAALDEVLAGGHREDSHVARDKYRHPKGTLAFFGLESDMRVVEISPGSGYYAEILAPLLKEEGEYIAAASALNSSRFGRRGLGNFLLKMAGSRIYEDTKITEFAFPDKLAMAPAGSVDMVLTFRNVHNWMGRHSEEAIFAAAYKALKPGGVFGVVEHRLNEDDASGKDTRDGYVKESYTIKVAEAIGFTLAGNSDVNNNPKDTKDHPSGVWTLPPRLAGDGDSEKYLAIGESDRFTLKFVKPAN